MKKITEFIDGLRMTKNIPGNDCLILKNGETVYRHMGGVSDVEKQIPMNGRERYHVYSASKPVTCTAALQLFERGMYKLEDELGDYLPEFKEMTVRTPEGEIVPAKKKITIKHLFTMTAGFSYWLGSPALLKCMEDTGGLCPTREVVRYLAQEPLLFEPGTRWEYSLCHDVLAAFVEVVSKMPFADYVQKYIFQPLNMTQSGFLLPQEELHTLSAHYDFSSGVLVRRNTELTGDNRANPYRLGPLHASGGAGLVTTVEDYMRFLEAWRKTDIILSRNTTELMTRNHLTAEQAVTYWNPALYDYGLGVRCPKAAGGVRKDFGWGGAAGAYLAVDQKNGLSLFYAQHVLSSAAQQIRGHIYDLAVNAFGN